MLPLIEAMDLTGSSTPTFDPTLFGFVVMNCTDYCSVKGWSPLLRLIGQQKHFHALRLLMNLTPSVARSCWISKGTSPLPEIFAKDIPAKTPVTPSKARSLVSAYEALQDFAQEAPGTISLQSVASLLREHNVIGDGLWSACSTEPVPDEAAAELRRASLDAMCKLGVNCGIDASEKGAAADDLTLPRNAAVPLAMPPVAEWLLPLIGIAGAGFAGVITSVASIFKRTKRRGLSFSVRNRARGSSASSGGGGHSMKRAASGDFQVDDCGLAQLLKMQLARHVYAKSGGFPVALSHFWLSAICEGASDWYQNAPFLRVADVVFETVFQNAKAQRLNARIVHATLRRILDAACEPNAKDPTLALVPSSGGGILFRSAAPSPIAKHPYVIFEALLSETLAEQPMWNVAGSVLGKPESRGVDIAKLKIAVSAECNVALGSSSPFSFGHTNTKILADYRIYKWARAALDCGAHVAVLPLVWQAFFALYFSRSPDHPNVCFGSIFLSSKKRGRRELIKQLSEQAQRHSDYFQAIAEKRVHTSATSSRLADFFRAVPSWLALDIDLGGISSSTPCLQRLAHLIRNPIFVRCENEHKIVRENFWHDLVRVEKVNEDPISVGWMPNHRSSSVVSALSSAAAKTDARRKAVMDFGFNPLLRPPDEISIQVEIPRVDVRVQIVSGATLPLAESCSEQFIRSSRRHAEKVSHHCAVDQQVLEMLPSLYRKEHRVVKEERVFERKVYHFEFRFDESVFDENMFQTILSMSQQTYLGQAGSVDDMKPLLISVLHMQQIVSGLVACHKDFSLSSGQAQKVAEAGLGWFWSLVKLESQELRSYEPVRCVIWDAITMLGEAFLRFEPHQVKDILVAVMQDDGKVPLLSPLFRPSANIPDTLPLYRMVWDAMERGMSWKRLMPLFSKFDFSKWLRDAKPTSADSTSLINMCVAVLRDLGWTFRDAWLMQTQKSLDPVPRTESALPKGQGIRFHLDAFLLMLKENFDDHFLLLVRVLVGATESGGGVLAQSKSVELHPFAWDAVMELSDETWASVDPRKAGLAFNILGAHFASLRQFRDDMPPMMLVDEWERIGLLPRFVKLMDRLCRALVRHAENEFAGPNRHDFLFTGAHSLWKHIQCVYEPWLCPAYHPVEVLPWKAASQETLSAFYDKFLHVLNTVLDLLKRACLEERNLYAGIAPQQHCPNQFLEHVWKWYHHRLAGCSDYKVLAQMGRAMESLPWEDFCLNPSTLADASSIITSHSEDHPCFALMVKIFPRINWAGTERGLTMDANPSAVASFYSLLLTTLLTVMGKLPYSSPFASFLQTVGPTLPWFHIPPEQYTVVLTTCGALVNSAKDADSKKRSVLLMQMLRLGAAMKPEYWANERKGLQSLERGAHYFILMRSALESLSPILVSNAESSSNGDDGITMKEAAALPFAPYSYINLLYDVVKEAEASFVAYLKASERAFADIDHCPAPVIGIVCQILSSLNVPGVPFFDPSKESGSIAPSILDSIDSLLSTVGIMPSGDDSHTALPPTAARPTQHWGSWESTWGYLAPSVVEASNQKNMLVTGTGVGSMLWLFVRANPSLAPVVVFSALRTIENEVSSVLLVEESLSAWNSFAHGQWAPIIKACNAHFSRMTPETKASFIASCTARGCALFLFVHSLWQCKIGNDTDTLPSIVGWISRLVLSSQRPEEVLHLCSVAMHLFIGSSGQDKIKYKLIRSFSDSISKISDESSGFLWRSKSKYPPNFRIAAKIISLLCRVNSKRGTKALRLSSAGPISKKSKTLIGSFRGLAKQKELSSFDETISWAADWLEDGSNTLLHYSSLLRGACERLFPESNIDIVDGNFAF